MSKSLSVDSVRRRVSERKSKTRSRSSSESNYLPDALVKMGTSMTNSVRLGVRDAVEIYRRRDEPATGGVGSLVVKMGSSTAAVVGFRPESRISEDDQYGAEIFVGQLGTFIAQDTEHRSQLGEPTHSDVTDHYDLSMEVNEHVDDGDDGASAYETPAEDSPDPIRKKPLDIEPDPFGFDLPDNASISSEEEPPISNLLDITVYARDEQRLRLRALLDTGAGVNIMREELVLRSGYPIEPLPPSSSSWSLICGNNERLHPLGKVKLRWYFNEIYSPARSYEISFLVVPDSTPFDVVLGWKFLKNARLFTANRSLAMSLPFKQSRSESKPRPRKKVAVEETERRKNREEEIMLRGKGANSNSNRKDESDLWIEWEHAIRTKRRDSHSKPFRHPAVLLIEANTIPHAERLPNSKLYCLHNQLTALMPPHRSDSAEVEYPQW
ncbi:MAG: hypothetical protein M1831_000980 [Alyxoria varia]|nr:MAG: hypothetical protein M1831_000980 [Alyxoria varia]